MQLLGVGKHYPGKIYGCQITSYTYNQSLANFMGGQYDGAYSGDELVENFTMLLLLVLPEMIVKDHIQMDGFD